MQSSETQVPVSLYISSENLGLWSRVPAQAGGARRTSAQPLGGLAPLPEASHSNALHSAIGPSPASLGLIASEMEAAAITDAEASAPSRCEQLAVSEGYNGITVELTNDRWRERWERMCILPAGDDPETNLPRSSSRPNVGRADGEVARTRASAETWRRNPFFHRTEVNFTRGDEVRNVTALASPWLELDSMDEGIRLDSEIALRQELAYASHLGVPHVVLPAPSSNPERRPFLADYARAVRACLTGVAGDTAPAGAWMTVSVSLPVSSPHLLSTILAREAQRLNGSVAIPAAAYLRTNDNWAWDTWETLQTLCGYHPRLRVALDLSMPLPPVTAIERWNAEPVSLLWLPSTSFLANAKGYPVLSKSAQRLLRQQLRRVPSIVLSGVAAPPSQHTRGGPSAYLEYVRYLCRTLPLQGAVEAFAQDYGDWLQTPLQPLSDNLDANTYEVFEQDPVKYALYGEAIFQALMQRAAASAVTRIWVVGAGRGMLVSRSLEAAQRANRVVHVTAVEKNPNACIALQDRLINEWGADRVTILPGDMRTLAPPHSMSERADIVVSELLGSFADNELSPECLDGAMRFLKRASRSARTTDSTANGISIPSSYMPLLAPVSSAKLHSTIRSAASAAAPTAPRASAGMGSSLISQTNFDSFYVVLLKSANTLSATGGPYGLEKVQPCWRFEHYPRESGATSDATGLPITNHHNVRTSVNTFYIPHAGLCHGLAGYFEAHLYGDISLSTVPDRESEDMISWFPTFFPFREPLYLPSNSELEVHIWRLTDDKRVWYEWSAEAFLNIDGASYDAQSHPDATSGSHDTSFAPQVAFSNAPTTPMMPSTSLMSPNPATFADASGNSGSLGLSTGTPSRPRSTLGATATPSNAPPATPKPPSAQSPPARRSANRRIKIAQTDIMNAGAKGSSLDFR